MEGANAMLLVSGVISATVCCVCACTMRRRAEKKKKSKQKRKLRLTNGPPTMLQPLKQRHRRLSVINAPLAATARGPKAPRGANGTIALNEDARNTEVIDHAAALLDEDATAVTKGKKHHKHHHKHKHKRKKTGKKKRKPSQAVINRHNSKKKNARHGSVATIEPVGEGHVKKKHKHKHKHHHRRKRGKQRRQSSAGKLESSAEYMPISYEISDRRHQTNLPKVNRRSGGADPEAHLTHITDEELIDRLSMEAQHNEMNRQHAVNSDRRRQQQRMSGKVAAEQLRRRSSGSFRRRGSAGTVVLGADGEGGSLLNHAGAPPVAGPKIGATNRRLSAGSLPLIGTERRASSEALGALRTSLTRRKDSQDARRSSDSYLNFEELGRSLPTIKSGRDFLLPSHVHRTLETIKSQRQLDVGAARGRPSLSSGGSRGSGRRLSAGGSSGRRLSAGSNPRRNSGGTRRRSSARSSSSGRSGHSRSSSGVQRDLEKIKLLGEHDAERLMEALDRDKARQHEATMRRLKRRESRIHIKKGNIETGKRLADQVDKEEAEAQRKAQARARGRRDSDSMRTVTEIRAEGRRHHEELLQAMEHEKKRQKKKMQRQLSEKKRTKEKFFEKGDRSGMAPK